MITLKLYGDESADETKQRVFAVAAVAGTESEWDAPVRKWLRRTRGLEFHAKNVESRYLNPDEDTRQQNRALYQDMTTILAGSHLVGVSAALDLPSLHACLPDLSLDVGYYKCFTEVLATCGRLAEGFNNDPREKHDIRLEFVFDSRPESDGAARTIYTKFRTLPAWSDASIFDTTVTFESGSCPRLEMADLLAREAMKELDRKITDPERRPRRSYQALADAHGGKQFIWLEYDRAYCEKWRDKVHSPEAKADLEAYKQWLARTGRVQHGRPHDNMLNRFLFYAWIEGRDAAAKRR